MPRGKRNTQKPKGPKSPRTQPPVHHTQTFWDWLSLILAIFVIAIVVLIVVYLTNIWWRHLEGTSRNRVQAWAMGATVLLPIVAVACLLLGMRVAALRINWFKRDWGEAIETTLAMVVNAGVDLADVRVYGARKLFMRENEKALDMDMRPALPWVDPQPGEMVEAKAKEVEEA